VRLDVATQPDPEASTEQVANHHVEDIPPPVRRSLADLPEARAELQATRRLEKVRLGRQADVRGPVQDVAEEG
jgi:hypothetical protein